MTHSKKDLETAERFIKELLAKCFSQHLDNERARAAAAKMCATFPKLARIKAVKS